MMIMPNESQIITPEVWVRLYFYIPNLQQYYLISNYGRIINELTGNIIPKRQDIDNDYTTVRLVFTDGHAECFQLHRLVAYVFVPNLTGDYSLEVNHKDSIKGHTWAWNLEWVTVQQNSIHAVEHGLIKIGEEHVNSIITNEQAHMVCKLISEGYTDTEIMNIIQINNCNVPKLIQNIKNGHCWNHVSKQYDFSNAYSRFNFTNDQIHAICKYFEDNGTEKTYREVLHHLGIDCNNWSDAEIKRIIVCISGIRKKKTYKNICSVYNYGY